MGFADAVTLADARVAAERTVLGNAGPHGLTAGAAAYQQVWARETAVAGLGLAVTADPEGRAVVRRSLDTLARFQSELGRIPHNVGEVGVADPALVFEGGALEGGATGQLVADTAHAGCVDSNLWFIIGHYYLAALTEDYEHAERAWPRLRAAYPWLENHDTNESGL